MVARGGGAKKASRGPASQRRAARKADRDGDIGMSLDGGVTKGRSNRVGKSSGTPNGSKASGSQPSRISASAKREILKHTGDLSMRDTRSSAPKSQIRLRITGWEKSKAATNPDGGVSSLIKWLEKKASTKLGSRKKTVKIQKSQVEGTDLTINVTSEDSRALLRMNGYEWAGTNITIEQVGGPVGASSTSSEAEKIKAMLRGVLERRYNLEDKFLDLSGLGQDEELKAQAMFDKKSTASKFFPAMMVVLENSFDTPAEKDAAIISVSLANNELADVTIVTSLSQTLPKLQNLDLSNNKIENLNALHPWRRRFYHLQHLILSNNPIEQKEPNYPAEVVPWYPNLRMLNNIQVRTEEEIAAKSKVNMPFPIRSPAFQDEGGIAENFVRTLFAGYDTDRAALAAHYYDAKSDFSYSLNTQAPRDPAASETTEKQEWDNYIKNSRNLKKISHLPARQNRMYRGTAAVADIFSKLPKTRHPDLASEARKWMIEAHIQPGVPDADGQYPTGVDGFMIVIHGEYDELDDSTGQAKKKRSFDRTFIVGPGGPAGVRVVSDMLNVRSYGGAQAFEPENIEGLSDPAAAQNAQQLDAPPQLPAGVTLEIAEQMVIQLAKQTGMTIEYAKLCLEQTQWNYEQGMAAFESNKASLPPTAFATAG